MGVPAPRSLRNYWWKLGPASAASGLFYHMIGNLRATAPLLRWPAARPPAQGSERSSAPAPRPPQRRWGFSMVAIPSFARARLRLGLVSTVRKRTILIRQFRSRQQKKLNETVARSDRAGHRVTKFGSGSGDSTPPCQDSNSAATTSNPRPRTGRISPSLETTVEAGESLTGEPLRHPLPAKQRSSPTRPRWVGAYASPDPYLKGSKLLSVRTNMLLQRPRVKLMRLAGPMLVNARYPA
jgi:hypothetical protein